MSINRIYIFYILVVLTNCLLLSCNWSGNDFFDNYTLKIIPDTIKYERNYGGHLQGMTTDYKQYLFWSHTTQLVKTDLNGKILKVVNVPTHHGDLAYFKGKLYVAVNLGKFNEEPGQENSWVYEFDAKDLELIQKIPVPELVHGAGGIAIHNKQVMIVGGLPDNGKYNKNFIYEYNLNFEFQKKHELPTGYTHLGIQTACYSYGYWYFGCYGNEVKKLKPVVLKTKDSKAGKLELIKIYDADMSHGLIGLSEDEFIYSCKTLDKMAAKLKLPE